MQYVPQFQPQLLYLVGQYLPRWNLVYATPFPSGFISLLKRTVGEIWSSLPLLLSCAPRPNDSYLSSRIAVTRQFSFMCLSSSCSKTHAEIYFMPSTGCDEAHHKALAYLKACHKSHSTITPIIAIKQT